ncbi:MAG: diguanylate cyclase [Thermodesulfobacteriota bacterium]
MFLILFVEILAVVALGSSILKRHNLVLVEHYKEMESIKTVKDMQLAYEDIKQVHLDFQKKARLINWTFLGGILLNIIFIFLIGFVYVRRRIVSPIIKLRDANSELKNGNINIKADIRQKDEIGELAASFNEMVAEIKRTREELEDFSITDHVTGVYNHRHFYKLLTAEFEKGKRYNYSIACVIFDVDYFKSINDIHGHQFGNLVLKEIGALVSSELRSTDTIARYGGDEFLILLPHTGVDAAFSFANKIRKKIEGYRFSRDSCSITTSISIGISISPDEHLNSPDDMIKNADAALYRAKMDGRNKTRIWSSEELSQDCIIADRCSVKELREDFSNLTVNIKKAYMESAISLIRNLDSKDKYSSGHSYNVTIYALKLANKIGFQEDELSALRYSSILHDIGKIGIQEGILKKKGRLTDGEFEVIKKHPVIAVDMMEGMRFWDKEIPIIRHHHERYDGLGYPDRLVGKRIPIGARILGLADTFDAITSERSYRGPKSVEQAIRELKADSGTHFDPELVALFVDMIGSGEI